MIALNRKATATFRRPAARWLVESNDGHVCHEAIGHRCQVKEGQAPSRRQPQGRYPDPPGVGKISGKGFLILVNAGQWCHIPRHRRRGWHVCPHGAAHPRSRLIVEKMAAGTLPRPHRGRGKISGKRFLILQQGHRLRSAILRSAPAAMTASQKAPVMGLSIMSWSRAFHIPIPLPDGRVLRTLRDAGEYIQELAREAHERPEWQMAAQMVLEAVEGKSLMFAEAAIRKAVDAGKPAPEPTPRRRGRR